jgi:hypothetical protein
VLISHPDVGRDQVHRQHQGRPDHHEGGRQHAQADLACTTVIHE